MSRKHRLDPILQHAETQQDTAAKNLAAALAQKKQAEEQLQQLLGYRHDYKKIQLQSQGHSIEELQNHQGFISKLGQAIEQQEREIERLERNVAQHIAYWQQAKTRSDGLDQLIQKHHRQSEQKEARAEQKEMDEFAGRMGRNRQL
ncbi:MAG: flagellar export protein FliJ [bacterium]